jgi:spore germination cell wall hydrolase CwlJ-like protein
VSRKLKLIRSKKTAGIFFIRGFALIALAFSGGVSAQTPFNPFASIPDNDDKAWDINCIAINVYHESRGERFKGQVGLAYVLKNRIRHKKRWGSDYCKAVYSKKQWSWTIDRKPDFITSRRGYDNALYVAELVYEGKVEDPTNGANHVYSGKEKPWWAKNMMVTAKIGNQVFLRE